MSFIEIRVQLERKYGYNESLDQVAQVSVNTSKPEPIQEIAYDAAAKLGFSSYANIKHHLQLKTRENIHGTIVEKKIQNTNELENGKLYLLALKPMNSGEEDDGSQIFESVNQHLVKASYGEDPVFENNDLVADDEWD